MNNDFYKGLQFQNANDETQKFDIDDNVLINLHSLQQNMSDAYCYKLCVKNELNKKFLEFTSYFEKYEEELLQNSLKITFSSKIVGYK